MRKTEVSINVKPFTYHQILESMMRCMNDERLIINFPQPLQDHFRRLGDAALKDQYSVIRRLLNGLAIGMVAELNKHLEHKSSIQELTKEDDV